MCTGPYLVLKELANKQKYKPKQNSVGPLPALRLERAAGIQGHPLQPNEFWVRQLRIQETLSKAKQNKPTDRTKQTHSQNNERKNKITLVTKTIYFKNGAKYLIDISKYSDGK